MNKYLLLGFLCLIFIFLIIKKEIFLKKNKSVSKVDYVTRPVTATDRWLNAEINILSSQATNINPVVLKAGLIAYLNARTKGLDEQKIMTLVDYSKSSNEKRLWVIDLKNNKVLFNTWVSHGKNSGSKLATSFSNDPRSLKSSIGVFLTDDTYEGHHGYSLRIKGLEPQINDHAYKRSIVFHGASYANASVALTQPMLGRSWGCLAVGVNVIKPLIETIKNHTLVVAYFPDTHWLSDSIFLKMNSSLL